MTAPTPEALRDTTQWLLTELLAAAWGIGDHALADVLATARDDVDSLDALPDPDPPME